MDDICFNLVADIFQSWGGAACKIVYGPTELPEESCFITVTKVWHNIDVEDNRIPVISGGFLLEFNLK